MKCATLVKFGIGLVCLGGLTSPALKADPKSRHRHQQITEQSEEERVVYLTGSNIPQKVKVKSIDRFGTQRPYFYAGGTAQHGTADSR